MGGRGSDKMLPAMIRARLSSFLPGPLRRGQAARFVVGAALCVGGVIAAGYLVFWWWHAPARWKNAASPPPGFASALVEFDGGRTDTGLSKLHDLSREWTHPVWDRRIAFLEGYWTGRQQLLEPAVIAFERAGDPSVSSAPGPEAFCLGPLVALSKASLLVRLNRPEEAARALDPLVGHYRELPWGEEILETWARATAEAGKPADALSRLDEALRSEVPREPESLHLLAGKLRQQRGDLPGAVAEFKLVHCRWPRSTESDRAMELIDSLPSPHRDWTMKDLPLLAERADRLADAGDTPGAAAVWTFARDRIPGGAVDPGLRVRLGSALALDGRTAAAAALLQVTPSDPVLARESLLARARIEISRSRLSLARDLLKPLLRGTDRDARREATLLLAAGADRLGKDADALAFYEQALPLMTVSGERDQACWRAGWLAFREKKYDRAIALFARLDRAEAHPGFRSAGLYWTARAEQARRRETEGERLLRTTLDRFRNDYYGLRAAERLGGAHPLAVRRRAPAPDPPSPLGNGVAAEREATSLDPTRFPVGTRFAVAAGEELVRLHLPAEASRVFEFAARQGPSDRELNLRLADLALARGDRTAALPWLRAAYPDLVRSASPTLPRRHSEALYPVDRWEDIRAAALRRSLDPWLICAVILQESAFNPLAVSKAGALGLMQILPDTGRDLARELDEGAWDRQRLLDPRLNVLFGTVYLSELIDRYDGRVEPALAAYNAGASRADRWWPASGRDPERFVEDIPFIETRLYVKRILSQWWMYRVLYEKG